MSVYLMLTATLALSGVVMTVLTLAYYRPGNVARRIRAMKKRPVSQSKLVRIALPNVILSGVLVYGLTWLLYPLLFGTDGGAGGGAVGSEASALRIVLEGAALLAIYDGLYYLVHRYPFHQWGPLKRVHAVHHTIKNTNAADALYLHPVENVIGLSLFWGCALLISLVAGPISIYSFGWAFCLYSLLNIAIHSGLKLSFFPLKTLTHLAERHYKHHAHMKAQNYSSVSPTLDIALGTEEA